MHVGKTVGQENLEWLWVHAMEQTIEFPFVQEPVATG